MPDPLGSSKQRLAAMQDEGYRRQPMGLDVLGNPCGRLFHDGTRHLMRPKTPGLVSHLVHIAVATCEIAPAVDLQNELTERDGTPAARH